MSVLVFAENWEGRFKKSTYEAVSYASAIAQQLSTECVAVTIGTVNEEDLKGLGKYGAVKVMSVQGDKLKNQDASVYTRMLGEAAQKAGATHVVISFTYTGKALAPRLSVRLKAGLVSGAIALPSSLNPFTVRKKCYSGKGLTDVVINTPIKLVALTPNSYNSCHRSFCSGCYRCRLQGDFQRSEKDFG